MVYFCFLQFSEGNLSSGAFPSLIPQRFSNSLPLFVCIKTHIKNLICLSRGVFLWKNLLAIAKVSAQSMEFQAIVKESFSNTFSEDSFFSIGDGIIPSEPSEWFPAHPDIFVNKYHTQIINQNFYLEKVILLRQSGPCCGGASW